MLHREEPDDELPPFLYYATCIARGSDPTAWADERPSSYWLNHHMLELPPVEAAVTAVTSVADEENAAKVPKLGLPEALANTLWPPQKFQYIPPKFLPKHENMIDWSAFEFPEPPPKHQNMLEWPDEERARPPLLIPYKGWPGPRTTPPPVPISPPPEAPTAIIPVIQPGDDPPTQILPLVRPPLVRELFGERHNTEPPDLEATRPRTRHPLGGST
jgi:hypothetical protein